MQAELYDRDLREHHGHDITECNDPDVTFYPQRQICRADMEKAAAEWWYGALHEKTPFHDGTFKHWSAERTARFRYHFGDGVGIIASATDLYPDDDFLERDKPAPESPAEGESD